VRGEGQAVAAHLEPKHQEIENQGRKTMPRSNGSFTITRRLAVAALVAPLMAAPALAQNAAPVASLAAYEGADRTQKLTEGARKEARSRSTRPRRWTT
jgi:hypothetical protein